MRHKSDPPPGPTEHAPHCTEPGYAWQAPIITGLPLLGRCIDCGAVAKRKAPISRGAA